MDYISYKDNEIFCDVDIGPYQGLTMPEYIRAIRGDWADAVAFESAETGVKFIHNKVLENGRSFGAGLLQHGFKKGDIIALVLPNVPEYCSILFGIWEVGLKACLINPVYTANELTYHFKLAEVNGVVTSPLLLETVQRAGGVDKIILLSDDEHQEGCLSTFRKMIQASTLATEFVKGSDIDTKNDTALILFSSGTTGLPKAVLLTHENVVGNSAQLRHPSTFPLLHRSFENGEGQGRFVGVLPFFHSFGLQVSAFCTLTLGAHTVTIAKFQPQLFAEVLRKHRPTAMAVVPPIIAVLNSDLVTEEDLASLRLLLTGAASTPKSHVEKLEAKCGGRVPLLTGYGLTELSPVGTYSRRLKLNSCGLPIPMTSFKIVDPETGASLPKFANGEVCLKGPQVMKGYLHNEEATLAAIDKEGWLHSGDLGFYDEEHHLFIVDRLKDIIKVKGFQVSPTELESLLKTHERVADAAVIGIQDEDDGQLPRAYIVLAADRDQRLLDQKQLNLLEKEIKTFILQYVAPFKQLKGGIEFIEQIPRNPTGKILRKELLLAYKNTFKS